MICEWHLARTGLAHFGAIFRSPACPALYCADIVIGIDSTGSLAEAIRAVWATRAAWLVGIGIIRGRVSRGWFGIAIIGPCVIGSTCWACRHTRFGFVVSELGGIALHALLGPIVLDCSRWAGGNTCMPRMIGIFASRACRTIFLCCTRTLPRGFAC